MKPKKCPTCGRTYIDETLSFCLEDGAPLVYHDSRAEPATAILPVAATSESPTRSMQSIGDHGAPRRTEEHALGGRKHLLVATAVFAVLIVGGAFAYFYGFAGGRHIDS